MATKKKNNQVDNLAQALLQAERLLEGKTPAEVLASQLVQQQETEERIKALESIYLIQKDILSFEEAAIYLNISKSSLYKMTAKHEIPHYKPNKYVFFEREVLDDWIRSAVVHSHEQVSNQANAYIMAKPFHI